MNKLDYEPDFIDGKYLGMISSDFVKVADYLREASYAIRSKGFSAFPIFIISRDELKIGQKLYARHELGNDWNYYASMVEEFAQLKLVDIEKLPDFQKTYKNPDEFCCLFVVDVDFVNFVFVPYPEDL